MLLYLVTTVAMTLYCEGLHTSHHSPAMVHCGLTAVFRLLAMRDDAHDAMQVLKEKQAAAALKIQVCFSPL